MEDGLNRWEEWSAQQAQQARFDPVFDHLHDLSRGPAPHGNNPRVQGLKADIHLGALGSGLKRGTS
jgi:hypothetical protein